LLGYKVTGATGREHLRAFRKKPTAGRPTDHSDWDSALPYVRFTYNTSRQETTERSPFFLMYGRHPVLPVDAICGADPDPSQIVLVESGGPGNYEEWMLGNLQKAFAEVDGKNQAA
jgi:hypothetical protein